MAGTDFNGLPVAGALLPTDVVPIQRGTGTDSTKQTTVADLQAGGGGAQTGDLLLTVRAPEGDWLEQDSVYLQAEYPELFALVGLLPDAPPGRLWTAATSPGVIPAICRVTDDIAVAVGNNTVWRTTDATATWTAIPVVGNLQAVAYLGNGVLIAAGVSGVILRSADSGATWASVASGTTQGLYNVLVMSQNVVLLTGSGGTVRRSVDAGLTFAAVTGFTSTTYDKSVRFSPLVAIIYQAINIAYRTVDAGATWTALTLTEASVGIVQQGYAFDSSTAVIPAQNGNWLRTINQGETWTVINVSGMPSSSGLIGVNAKRAVWPGGSGTGYITDDAGLTWTSVGSVYGRFGAALNKALLYSYDKSGTTAAKSRAEYAYDTATMFKTPMIGDVRGYIKP